MTVVVPAARAARDAVSYIDADVQNDVPSVTALLPYLSAYWRETIANTGFGGPGMSVYPDGLPISRRPGTSIDTHAGAHMSGVSEQVLLPDVEFAILSCPYAVDSIHNPDGASAMASAVNDWQIEHWLERDSRLLASIVVPSQFPHAAAAEIARVGGHPQFVQVSLPARSPIPYGRREYLPVLEAALSDDLAVAIQYGGFTGNPPTPVGWPTYYTEEYVGMAGVYQSQLISLVAEGTFDRLSALRVVLVGSGFTWLPPLLWRLDKDWKGLRREVPWVRRAPSEHILTHVRFTTHPIDAPDTSGFLSDVVRQMHGYETLMYGSGYPRWEFGDHRSDLRAMLSSGDLQRVCSANAREFYRIP